MSVDQARKQARNKNTSAEILEQLANSEDKLTLQYIASNPNTPLRALNKLCKEFPDQVFSNPALDMVIANKSQKLPINLMIEREKYLGITEAVFAAAAGCEDAEVWSQALEFDLDKLRKQAQDKTTPPSVLSKLANNEDRLVRQYVASNPNTPLKSLEKLGTEFPHEVVDNAKTSAEILKQLLANNRAKKRSPILYQKILNHPNSSEEIIYAVVSRCSDNSVRESALDCAKTSAKSLKAIALERDIIGKPDNYQLLIKHPHVSAEIITIAQIVIDHKAITPEVLIEFVCRSYGLETAAKAAFRHQNMSAEILAQLSLSEFELVKVAVAKHPKTTVATLKHLTKDENGFILATILKRDRIPQEIVAILTDDPSESIRLLVAKMEDLTPQTITKLTNDPCELVRRLTVKMQDVASENITKLANDPSESVRALIATKTNLTSEIVTRLFKDPSKQVRAKILKYHLKELNPETLLKLAQDPDEAVRCHLIESNPHLIDIIPEILVQLTQDKSEVVRADVAYHQKLSEKLIVMLACDPSLIVRSALVDDRNYTHHSMGLNSHLPLAILWKMLEQNEVDPDLASSPPLTNVWMDIETRNYEPSARLVNFYLKKAITKHPETPLDYLMILIKDEDEQIRAAAASSSKLSATILNEMINDQSKSVRFAVLDNPSVGSDTLQLYLAKNKGVRMCIGGGIFKARQQLRKREKTAIRGMANLISWQKPLDTNTWVRTCRIINKAGEKLG